MKNRSNIMLRLASFLFVAVLVSTVMLSGLLARYTTSSTSGDSARVIKFNNVEIEENASFTNGKLVICPGVPIEKDVEVFFEGSESATYLFIRLDVTGDWTSSDGIHFNISNLVNFSINTNEWTYLDGSNYVYYKAVAPNTTVGSIDGYGHQGVDVILDGTITVDEKVTMDHLKTMKPGNLDFSAIVVQSNGFETVGDAWDSVKVK